MFAQQPDRRFQPPAAAGNRIAEFVGNKATFYAVYPDPPVVKRSARMPRFPLARLWRVSGASLARSSDAW